MLRASPDDYLLDSALAMQDKNLRKGKNIMLTKMVYMTVHKNDALSCRDLISRNHSSIFRLQIVRFYY